MLAEKKITEFLEDLASDLPAPGGGGAAALSGAMGACLIAMVARLTIGKKGYEEVEAEMVDIISRSDQLYKNLAAQVDEDAAAFNEVIAAMKMPKENDSQTRLRAEAMQKSFRRAAEVPYAIAVNCMEVLDLAALIAGKGNTNLISDVGVAAEVALAGLESTMLNVRINLPYIKDEEYVTKTRRQMEIMTRSARSVKAQVLNLVSSQIG
ncbi:MAG TPA: cyclodeaminase/cyclohydrolase family protein [Syntrophomonadaceae bacterium]|nr:cyclodeaminase/cyclohydrolase family protein [Syntrophomonadaceae bacterium]HPR94003.1 cyclodeaminase/cyclohydrolase family protein [Syntrophomonadaceae bacterium]